MSRSLLSARRVALAVATLVLPAGTAAAQTQVVYGDGTTFTSPAPAPGAADPACALAQDTWCARNVRANAEVGITTDYTRGANGALYFTSNGSAAKADFERYFSTPFTLGAVESLGYAWYRDAASTNSAVQVPSLRLILGVAGPVAGLYLPTGYLIYEPTYNGIAITPGTWQSASIGSTGRFWLNGNDGTYLTLAQWQAGDGAAVGGRGVTGSTLVIGLSTGVGSGWAGTFEGAVDEVSYRTSGMSQAVTYDFAVSAVPEPSTYVLMATGLLGVLGMARRRRSA